MPLALTDGQLETVMAVAAGIPPEKRGLFLERLGAMLVLRRGPGRFNDQDVTDAARLALTGLAQQPAA